MRRGQALQNWIYVQSHWWKYTQLIQESQVYNHEHIISNGLINVTTQSFPLNWMDPWLLILSATHVMIKKQFIKLPRAWFIFTSYIVLACTHYGPGLLASLASRSQGDF